MTDTSDASVQAVTTEEQPEPLPPPGTVDFASLVQQRAVEALQSGSLRITTTHGLQAQALLDRRAEKQADRDLALNMARLLSGSISMTPMTVVEGRVIEESDAPDILAPVDLIEARNA